MILDVLAAVCLLGGSFLAFTAALGLVRFGSLLARMHTAAKPQVLGLILLLVGLGLRLRTGSVLWMLVLVALFQLGTSPVAAHMLSRAGYRTAKVRPDLLVVDELTRDIEAARAAGQEVPVDGQVAEVTDVPTDVRGDPPAGPPAT